MSSPYAEPDLQSLQQRTGKSLGVSQFLDVAIATCEALSDLHRDGLHGDLRPSNLLWDEERGEVRLRGAVAEAVGGQLQDVYRQDFPVESLPYLAPERAGYALSTPDQRSDLYALGVTFYELLAGALPFEGHDVLQWVHCHVAQRPRPLLARAPSVPAPLADLVMKLLAKDPEDRYQTAAGLARDLIRCRTELETKGRIEPFALGADDMSDEFRIPHKLYGRDNDVETLRAAFERVAATGTPELVLITGSAGIGKSSLVEPLYGAVVRAHGFLLSGKADQYERGTPYSALVQALGGLVERLLTESEARLATWKRRINDALRPNGQLILDLIPRMQLVLGPQAPLEHLPGNQAQNRFDMVFQELFGALALREHPLVLFLDDLQWADAASIWLLTHLLTRPDLRHLLVVGVYRDNEVGGSHPLSVALGEIQRAGVRTERIRLGPLSTDHVAQLIADTFHCTPADAEALAELVAQRTGGNPFFVTQLLAKLHKDGLVRFDAETSSWRWDISELEATQFTDNVVELMLDKLRRLPEDTRTALTLAACMGAEFDAAMLALVCGEPEDAIHQRLKSAVRDGLLLRRGDAYTFLHDRVQQAAYLMIPEAEQAGVHLKIGRAILENTPEPQLADKIFAIVNQQNRGAATIATRAEQRRLAELNLIAGRKAKAASAFNVASSYLAAGAAMLDEASWEEHYDLIYALTWERAECEHLSGNPAETERLCGAILAHARTALDKQVAYRLKIELYTGLLQSEQAILTCAECLKTLGIELSLSPSPGDVEAELQKIWEALDGRAIEGLIDLPAMTNLEMRAAMTALSITYVSAWRLNEALCHLMVSRMVHLSIVHGNADASAMSYATIGMVLVRLKDYRRAYRFGRLGYDLVRRGGTAYWTATVGNTFGCMVAVWAEPLRQCIQYSRSSLIAATSSGNVPFLAFSCMHIVTGSLATGAPLDATYREGEKLVDLTRTLKIADGTRVLLGALRFIQRMRGFTDGLGTFNGPDFNQASYEAELLAAGSPTAVLYYYVFKTQASIIAGDHESAVAAATRLKDVLWVNGLQFSLIEAHFYCALAWLGRLSTAPEDSRSAHLAAISDHAALVAEVAEVCPTNFLHMHALLSAERSRVEGRDVEAMRRYDQAIAAARAEGFVQCEALANELAARFYSGRGFSTIADVYLREARSCYARWGAHGKVKELERQFPDAVADRAGRRGQAGIADLDALTVAKAAQAISSEIVLDRLLGTLLRIVLEHTGAERCCLFVRRAELLLAAQASVGARGVEVEVEPSGGLSPHLPESLINYVHRTHERVLLDDATAHPNFSADCYIAQHRPKSVLCMPILRKASLLGILYLENSLTAGAFTARRIALLDFIAAQAAISIENADLYEERERENAERRRAEEAARESEEELRQLIETVNVIPWEADAATGRFTYIGPQAEQVLGYPAESWYSSDFLSSHGAPSEGALRTIFDASKGGRADAEIELKAKDGRPVWLHAVASPVRKRRGGEVLGGFLFDITERKLTEQILREKLEIIERQREEIRTLTTPVIQVWDGVLMMPVLSSVDAKTAANMMDLLLGAVVRTRSRITILDLTAVEVLDPATADHLVRLVSAVQLLGAQGVVVGIRPEVAQTLVATGGDLSSIRTLANLRDALLLCMKDDRKRRRRRW